MRNETRNCRGTNDVVSFRFNWLCSLHKYTNSKSLLPLLLDETIDVNIKYFLGT